MRPFLHQQLLRAARVSLVIGAWLALARTGYA